MSELIKSFLRASRWTVLSVGIKSISSLLFNKLIALYLGPTGITLQAHVMNLFNALLAIPQEGTNKAVIKFLSPENSPSRSSYQFIFGGFVINILVFVLLSVYLFLNNATFFRLFSFGDSQLAWGAIFLVSVFCYIFNTFFLSFLQVIQNFKTYAILNTLGNLFGLFSIALFITQKSDWILLGLPIGLALALIPTLVFAYPVIRQFLRPVQWSLKESKPHLTAMTGFVLMAVSVLLFEYVTSFAMREYSIRYFNSENTGFWQSASTLSSYYMAAFSAVVMSVYYPQAASKINKPHELSRYVRGIIALLLPIILIGLSAVFFFKDVLLQLLFTADFSKAESLFRFQLLGDFFKLISFLLAALLLAKGKVTQFIVLQAVSASIYITTIPLIADSWGLEAFPFAHFLRNIVYCFLLFILCRKIVFGKG